MDIRRFRISLTGLRCVFMGAFMHPGRWGRQEKMVGRERIELSTDIASGFTDRRTALWCILPRLVRPEGLEPPPRRTGF